MKYIILILKCLNINDLSLKSLIDDYGFINYNKNHIYIKNY